MKANEPTVYATIDKVTGWRLFLKTILARSYPRIIGQQRERSWIFFEIFMPMLAVASYVYVYRAIGAPEEYVGFVVVGGAMTAFWMNVLWSMSSQLYWEKEQGNLALYIMAPNSMMAVLLGMALGGLVATTMRAVAIIFVGTLMFNVQFTVSSFSQLFAVFFLAMTALYGMGMMSASAAKPGTSPTWRRNRSISFRGFTSRSSPSTSGWRRRLRSSRSPSGWMRCGS